MESRHALIFSLCITLLIALNFSLYTEFHHTTRVAAVERVIDGDTLVLNSGETIRLVNINSPEKNRPGYSEAKDFLKQLDGQTIQIESLGLDKYKRTLARIYAPQYINLEIVSNGFANKYLVHEGEEKKFKEAEETAIFEQKGIWRGSEYAGCFTLQTNEEEKKVTLENLCNSINLENWKFKDESRKEYNFGNVSLKVHETYEFYPENAGIWDKTNTIYLLDQDGKLVYHQVHGY